ncbi:hypothetical protein EW146_g7661 [Bondarzewia mesenterica]|uniref:Ubiquitin-like domain-containing protein n=1 Tax=Bondarzewia mesenterica TaxID=1095465 RepID=A0A4S4LLY3_9AGAM|nr:hypothetical protein EW146_g7661 [Bondarzewia mesenterica]
MADEQQPQTEVTPKVEDGNAPINVKVVTSQGEEVFFKIKRNTKLSKLQGAYANKVGKDVGSIRFLYDGSRITDDDTPASLDMEDNDTIDVMVEPPTNPAAAIAPFDTLTPTTPPFNTALSEKGADAKPEAELCVTVLATTGLERSMLELVVTTVTQVETAGREPVLTEGTRMAEEEVDTIVGREAKLDVLKPTGEVAMELTDMGRGVETTDRELSEEARMAEEEMDTMVGREAKLDVLKLIGGVATELTNTVVTAVVSTGTALDGERTRDRQQLGRQKCENEGEDDGAPHDTGVLLSMKFEARELVIERK